MKRLLLPLLSALLVAFAAAPVHADFAAGAEAYDGGDYATAFAEWRALAEAGDAMAQTALAGMYRFGEGRRVDLAEAVRWYRKAAGNGDTVAQMNLGEMYRRGLGVGRDRVRAWLWFSLAAGQGRVWAAEQLAKLEPAMAPGEIQAARTLLRDRNELKKPC